MLSDDKNCELLMDQIRDRNGNTFEAFKLFVQMFSAIVGGTTFLRFQPDKHIPASFAWLADGLAILVVVVCAIAIRENVRAWKGYRDRITQVAGLDTNGNYIIRPPDVVKASKVEFTMLGVMGIAALLFLFFNPLNS